MKSCESESDTSQNKQWIFALADLVLYNYTASNKVVQNIPMSHGATTECHIIMSDLVTALYL